jgi:hypothetical protein
MTLKPSIAIAFFGIPRSGEYAFDSIRKNILLPASKAGSLYACYHFYQQSRVENPRTKEFGNLPLSDYKPYAQFHGTLDQPEIINQVFDLEAIFRCGDPWLDDFKSLRNLLMQLHSLGVVARQALLYCPDVVVFARPDLVYHDSIGPVLDKAIQKRHLSIARIPSWQWSKGYNDRFAVCTKQAIEWYAFRHKLINEYLKVLDMPLHSEALLKYALDRSLCPVSPFSARASRVRIDGHLVDEGFKPLRGSKMLKFQLKEICKKITSIL